MADFSGRKIAYGIGRETTRGTAVTAAYWAKHLSATFQNKSTTILNPSVLGVLDQNSDAEIVEDYADGNIAGKVTDQAIGLLLYNILGSYAVGNHTGETTVKDHTFTESQSSTGPSLTITRKDPNSDKQYPLAMQSQLELSCQVGDWVKWQSTLTSKKGVTATDTTAYVAENEFKAKHMSAKVATNLAGLTGAVAIPLKSFKLTIDKKLNPYFVFGSNDPSEIFGEEFNVHGEFVLRYTDQTYENLRYNNTYQALQFDMTNGDITIGTASHPELNFQMPKVVLNTWTINQTPDGMVEQTVGFQGLYDLVTAMQLKAILTNTVTTY